MLNTVIIMGRLTADPEMRSTASGLPVASFTLAVDRDFQSGSERVTDFIDVVAWRQRAEFVSKYFRKGQQMAVKGSIQVRNYTDKDGNKRRAWEVVADNVYFADSKRDSSYEGSTYGGSSYSSNTASEQPASFSNGSNDDFTPIVDDDLPF